MWNINVEYIKKLLQKSHDGNSMQLNVTVLCQTFPDMDSQLQYICVTSYLQPIHHHILSTTWNDEESNDSMKTGRIMFSYCQHWIIFSTFHKCACTKHL